MRKGRPFELNIWYIKLCDISDYTVTFALDLSLGSWPFCRFSILSGLKHLKLCFCSILQPSSLKCLLCLHVVCFLGALLGVKIISLLKCQLLSPQKLHSCHLLLDNKYPIFSHLANYVVTAVSIATPYSALTVIYMYCCIQWQNLKYVPNIVILTDAINGQTSNMPLYINNWGFLYSAHPVVHKSGALSIYLWGYGTWSTHTFLHFKSRWYCVF